MSFGGAARGCPTSEVTAAKLRVRLGEWRWCSANCSVAASGSTIARSGGKGLCLHRRSLFNPRSKAGLSCSLIALNNQSSGRKRQSSTSAIMSTTGTFRGTPKTGRGQPAFSDSPSNIPIPRPKLESTVSDAGSSFSSSRAKQSKRDEV